MNVSGTDATIAISDAERRHRKNGAVLTFEFKIQFVLSGDKNLDQIDNGGEGGESSEGSCGIAL
ncbi:MAG: hypothetical protein WAM42_24015 [Candidatus Nitrosopolaris sp.]